MFFRSFIFCLLFLRVRSDNEWTVACQFLWDEAGEMSVLDVACKNYAQAVLAGYAFILTSAADGKKPGNIELQGESKTHDIRNAFDCMKVNNATECNVTKTRSGFACNWCQVSEKWKGAKKYDEYKKHIEPGSCIIGDSTMGDSVICDSMQSASVEPMYDDIVTKKKSKIPPAAQIVQCLELISSPDDCNKNKNCATCGVPDVWSWRWSKEQKIVNNRMTVCHVKSLLFNENETGEEDGWCKMWQDIPVGAKNALLLPGQTTVLDQTTVPDLDHKIKIVSPSSTSTTTSDSSGQRWLGCYLILTMAAVGTYL